MDFCIHCTATQRTPPSFLPHADTKARKPHRNSATRGRSHDGLTSLRRRNGAPPVRMSRGMVTPSVQTSLILVGTSISTPRRVVHGRCPRVCPGDRGPRRAWAPARAARWSLRRVAVVTSERAGDRTPPKGGAHLACGRRPGAAGAPPMWTVGPGHQALTGARAPVAVPPIAVDPGVSPPTPTRPAAPGCGPRSAGGSTAGPSRRACRRCPWPPPSAAVRPGSGRPGAPGR